MIDFIPIGQENAILLKDLAAITGKSPRTVQAEIKDLRDKNWLRAKGACNHVRNWKTNQKRR